MELVVVIGGPSQKGFIRQWMEQQFHYLSKQEFLFIGVDGGSVKLVEEDLPIRLAIGDFDSITEEERVAVFAQAEEVKQFPAAKDNTDFEEALLWIGTQYPKIPIHVLGAFGGRVDHALSCVWTAFRPDLATVVPFLQLEDVYNHVSFLHPGNYTLQKREGTKYLSFITMTSVTGLTLQQVVYPLEKQDYSTPMALISNEFLEEKMQISFETGLILVAQTRDSWR